MSKRIFTLEEGAVPGRSAKGWKVEGEIEEESQEQSARGYGEHSTLEGSWHTTALWNIAKNREDRGALPKEISDIV